MMKAPLTKVNVVKKLETIYWRALQDGNLCVALRAAELQGKTVNLFERQMLPKVVRIADMTEEQLTEFIDRLETRDPSLKDQEVKPAKEDHVPEREPDGQATILETPNLQEKAASGGEYGNPPDPTDFAPAARHGLPERQERPVDNLHGREKDTAEGSALSRPHPPPERERERPLPCIWSIF